ncbi:hypothetical protein Tco_1135147 [Tanacetum coccineum]
MQGQSKPKPVEVHEHYGLSYFDFSVLQNTKDGPKTFTKQTSSSFFGMAQRTPTYPKTLEEPIPSRHPTSYPGTSQNPGTPHIATPMVQPGFALWSSTNQAGPSQNPNVGRVNPLSPFTCMPTTTVAPKKGANNIRNTTRNAKVSPFNLGKASIDLNSPVGELMYMGSRATDDYISLHNVDPNKVVRNKSICPSIVDVITRGQAPLLYQADPIEFFSAIRVQMCLRLYDCRCEDTLECGYD